MVVASFDIEWENNKAHQRMLQRIVEPKDRISEIEELIRSQHPLAVVIDAVAAGPEFLDELDEKGIPLFRIYPEGKAVDEQSYTNRRAELYFRMISWLKSKRGIKLKKNDNFIEQLKVIKPMVRKGGKWFVESREELMERGIECDELDANAFCFVKEDEWEDSPGIFMIGRGRTSEYGRNW